MLVSVSVRVSECYALAWRRFDAEKCLEGLTLGLLEGERCK